METVIEAEQLPGPMPSSARPGPFSLSVIVPMYNEAEVVDAFLETLLPICRSLTDDFEILCVDDGSVDATARLVAAWIEREPAISLMVFTRNFGKEAALTALIDHASGDAVVSIDADLQQPPATIPKLVAKWQEGYDTVCARRADRGTDGKMRALFSRNFYRFFNRIADTSIPLEVSDFRLLDRSVVDALKRLPERTRFMKGLFAWVGFSTAVISYEHSERAGGASSFKFWKLWNLALDGITSFSTFPLRVWSYLGIIAAFFAFLYGSFILLRTLVFGVDVPGYASLLVFVLFLGGIQLISLGVIGEYLGRLMIEAKGRPLYLVRERLNLQDRHGQDGEKEPRR
ncbi:MAG: glycosyltransferase family 2 protein [Pseudomonadota bacterium]